MKTTKTKNGIIVTVLLAIALCLASGGIAAVQAAEPTYYVCFSTENYAVRNANRMTATADGYILEDVSLIGATGFYVTDNAGTRYMSKDNKDLHTDETGSYSYDILFNADGVFGADWESTGCRVSYRFHTPDAYGVTVSGSSVPLAYNPYFTAYDQYYISSVFVAAGQTIACDGEIHTVSADGYYRILFTPGETRTGNTYLFNDKGEYGSGDGYVYKLYIEDAPRYFAAIVSGATLADSDEINGEPACLLTRDEKAVAVKRYVGGKMFVGSRDTVLKYRIYEQTGADYRLIDDDGDEDTDISKIDVSDTGWYTLRFTDGGAAFAVSAQYEETDFGGYYAAGEFNNYCYNASGGLNLNDKYEFKKIEDGDDDYDADFEQYVLNIDVTKAQAKDGFELYITDGKTKYKNGAEYIKLNAEGSYKFLLSDEHDYGRGRHYRYTLESGDPQETDVVISTADEYNTFALACNKEADYSRGKTVYIKNDIDFAGKNAVPIKTFGGKIEGGYHTLKNVAMSSDNGKCGLIWLLTKNGSVERLNAELTADAGNGNYVGLICENYGLVKDVTVGGSIKGNGYVGGVVGYNGRTAASSDDIINDSGDAYVTGKVQGCVNKATVKGKTYVGGIVGYNGGEIESCENRGVINEAAASDSVLGTGGICGFSYGKITDCENLGKVGGKFGSATGGICGACTGEIYFSVNRANVGGNRYAGGTVGYYGVSGEENSGSGSGNGYDDIISGIVSGGSAEETGQPDGQNHILIYNLNFGDVTAESYVGGIVGYTQRNTLLIKACASNGDVRATAGSYAGGVCGYSAAETVGCIGLGRVTAEGLNGGSYAGGVCGYGENVKYCSSSAAVEGVDYVGGICGGHSGKLIGSYSDTLLVADENATHVGGICGQSAAYDSSSDSFTDVRSNYFTGDFGGINGETYGSEYGNAATRIASADLSSQGALSPKLDVGFDSEYWLGGKDTLSYPVSRLFEEVCECAAFGDEARFDELFGAHAEELAAVSARGARIGYNVVFKEWNKDNGDLYDPDIQYGNFDTVAAVRYFVGDEIIPPEFKYAEKENGKWVCRGDKAEYFVRYTIPTELGENTVIYAEYDEIQTSLFCDGAGGSAFVEGRFGSAAKAELVRVGDYYKIVITGDSADGPVTVKFRVGDKAEKYVVKVIVNGEAVRADSAVRGEYIAFEYTPGELFCAEYKSNGLPAWAYALIFSAVGAAAVGAIWLTVWLLARKRKHKDA